VDVEPKSQEPTEFVCDELSEVLGGRIHVQDDECVIVVY
jgi:hypothetical protein